jgi:hypothetical protein
MRGNVVEMQKSVIGALLRRFLHQFLVEILRTLSTKNERVKVSFACQAIMLPIPKRKKQTQIVDFFSPIHGRTRVDFAIATPAHINNRRLWDRIQVSSSV